MKQCIVCKQTNNEVMTDTPDGPVHLGQCIIHYQDIQSNLSESEGSQVLQETELL